MPDHRHRVLGALLAAVVLVLAAPAAASAKVPSGWVGVVVSDNSLLNSASAWPHETSVMKQSRVQSVRIPVYWTNMQQSENGPVSFTALDAQVLGAAKQHLRIMPSVLRAPTWARIKASDVGSPPRDPAEFAAFMKQLVKRYGSKGTFWSSHRSVPKVPITAWQIWNEVNLSGYWSTQPFAKSYVSLLKATRKSVKSADSRAKIVLAGLPNDSWTQLSTIYAAGGRRYFDAAAVHPYTASVSNVLKIVALDRKAMAKGHDSTKPIYLTEMGFSSAGKRISAAQKAHVTWNTTESGQAKQLGKLYAALASKRKSLRIAGAFWYSWYTSEVNTHHSWDEYTGLRRYGKGKIVSKPALAALKKVTKAIE